MKLTKIQRVLKLKQSGWMKKYIDFNTGKRMNAANDLEKKNLKLMINSVYMSLVKGLLILNMLKDIQYSSMSKSCKNN